jgi:hypothetical protein
MITIGNILVSKKILTEQFVCDLERCKGGCCTEGEAGARLDESELEKMDEAYEHVKPYLSPESIKEIEDQGLYMGHKKFGWVTPIVGSNRVCVYGIDGGNGIVKCGIEQAFSDGKINWKKPISCHLFPIDVKSSRVDDANVSVSYEPLRDKCKEACALGQSLKVPVYQFLREPLVLRFGQDFYDSLEAIAQQSQTP